MKLNYISTLSLNNSLRASTLNKQVALNQAQIELTTGRHADIGRELGAFTSSSISLERQVLLIDQTTVTNSVMRNGMSTMQGAMTSTIKQANNFIGQLTAELSNRLDPDLRSALGKTMLEGWTSNVNVTFKGEYLFSGLNTDSKALVSYGDGGGAAAQTAVQNAFFTTFGFNADDPAAQALTATDMENFINGAFDALFDDSNWETLWSGSSEKGRKSKISNNEFTENPVTAFNQAFRTVTAASVLIAEFGDANLDSVAMDKLVSITVSKMSAGISQMGKEQANLGLVEARVKTAQEYMNFQKDILKTQLSDLTSVDPYSAALRLNQLTTSLQASYAATSRIQSLSLLNFI